MTEMRYSLHHRLQVIPAAPSEKIETEQRAKEIKYLRLQTILAAVGVLISGLLSAAGIWIGVQLTQASNRDRTRELEMNRVVQVENNVRAAEQACLELTIRLRESVRNPFTDAEGMVIRNQINTICNAARINLRDRRIRDEAWERAIGRFVLDAVTASRNEDNQVSDGQ